MQDVKLIAATEKDIKKIAKLATRIWNQHYPDIIGRKQTDYMLNLLYSERALRDQLFPKGITVKKQDYYLINFQDTSVGFLSTHRENKGECFINKFYIDQTNAAKGIGTLVFEKLQELIKPKKIRLTVNRKNYKSINFYFKLGFKIESIVDIDIGNNFVMNDFIMIWMKL